MSLQKAKKAFIFPILSLHKLIAIVIDIRQTPKEKKEMYTTSNQEGLLNNYALETPVYYAEYPNETQQRRYAIQGALAILLVNFLFMIAFAVS